MPANFPLFLAPMAGVTNTVFRRICKAKGADVRDDRICLRGRHPPQKQRARNTTWNFRKTSVLVGVQLFGAEPERLAAAARAVIDWVRPDFLDLNFGCPANKVVCKNGGSSLLKNRPLLAADGERRRAGRRIRCR